MSDDATTNSEENTTISDFPSSDSSILKTQTAIQSLSSILPSLPPSLPSSTSPAFSLLHDPDFCSQISSLLHHPNSGSGDNNLCRWLYDTFQSGVPDLQLLVLRFLPTIAGLYLSRVLHRKPLAGFEAVLLALYAHETTSRAGQAITVNIPNLSLPTIYHESKESIKNSNATNLNLAIISSSLEPHGTVRSTRRARIVGVALELFYSKIPQMPVGSKIDFCKFCKVWAGQDGDMYKNEVEDKKKEDENEYSDGKEEEGEKGKNVQKEGKIPLPWELLQPALRILGHCVMGPHNDKDLLDVACDACRCLYARSIHDIDPKAILAIGSLLRLAKLEIERVDDFDPTEIPITDVINL